MAFYFKNNIISIITCVILNGLKQGLLACKQNVGSVHNDHMIISFLIAISEGRSMLSLQEESRLLAHSSERLNRFTIK